MKEELTHNERRSWAKCLYTNTDEDLQDIALQVSADEATLRNWISTGAWDGMKRTQLTSKNAQLNNLYKLLDKLGEKLQSDEVTVKDVDIYTKYTTAIKNLETGLPVGNVIEVSGLFIKWLRKKDLALAQKVTLHYDVFIQQKLTPHSS